MMEFGPLGLFVYWTLLTNAYWWAFMHKGAGFTVVVSPLISLIQDQVQVYCGVVFVCITDDSHIASSLHRQCCSMRLPATELRARCAAISRERTRQRSTES